MCCLEKKEVMNQRPQQVRFATQVQNQFECLVNDEDEDEGDECKDCMSWPVVGKGGKVNKGAKGVLRKGQLGAKFIKFGKISKQDVKFIGAVAQGEEQATMGLCFQVTDVRKPLVQLK